MRYLLFKEIQQKLISSIYYIFSTLIIILCILNGVINEIKYKENIKCFYEAIHNAKNDLEKIKTLDELAFFKQKIFCAPSDKGFISDNYEGILPFGVELFYFNYPFPSNTGYCKAEKNAYEDINLVNIIVFIISLFTFSITYDSINREIADGTFNLVLSNSVSKTKIFFSKYVSHLILILIPILIGILINIIQFQFIIQYSIELFITLVYFLLIVILFLSLNIVISLLFSSLTLKPSISLNYCLLVWLTFIFIIPQVGNINAKYKYRLGSKEMVWSEAINEGFKLFFDSGKHSSEWWDSWIGKEPNDNLKSRISGWNEVQSFVNSKVKDLHNNNKSQYRNYLKIACISPYKLFEYSTEILFNTGVTRQIDFENKILIYSNSLNSFINQSDRKDISSYHYIWNEPSLSKFFMSRKEINNNEVPKFSYSPPNVYDRISSSFKYLILFILYNIVLVLIIIMSFNFFYRK
jgi:ABC-type transport system involved in multi-copper enzyme maturation permease subunit